MADMPCADLMPAPSDPHPIPVDCCKPSSCDLSTCLGTAYLHALPGIVASIPMDSMYVTANVRAHPLQWLGMGRFVYLCRGHGGDVRCCADQRVRNSHKAHLLPPHLRISCDRCCWRSAQIRC